MQRERSTVSRWRIHVLLQTSTIIAYRAIFGIYDLTRKHYRGERPPMVMNVAIAEVFMPNVQRQPTTGGAKGRDRDLRKSVGMRVCLPVGPGQRVTGQRMGTITDSPTKQACRIFNGPRDGASR